MKEVEIGYLRLGYMVEFVKEFRSAFGINEKNQSRRLNAHMMKEELNEYLDAENSVEVLDALTDVLYLLIGAYVREGYSSEDIFSAFIEVHASNMSKLENGEPVVLHNGKIGKGSNYRKPDLTSIAK